MGSEFNSDPIFRSDIERDIRALGPRDRARLLKALIKDLDGPADPDADRAWIEESERRMAEIESGAAKTIPGPEVLKEAHSRLK